MASVEDVLEGLLAAASQALLAVGRPAGRAFVAPGELVAWDDCCDGGGQVWVRLAQVTPHPSTKPACGSRLLQATVELGTVRCAHTLDSLGTPPSSAQLTSDALKGVADMKALLRALTCLSKGIDGLMSITPQLWTPTGPEGGCVGGTWMALASLDAS